MGFKAPTRFINEMLKSRVAKKIDRMLPGGLRRKRRELALKKALKKSLQKYGEMRMKCDHTYASITGFQQKRPTLFVARGADPVWVFRLIENYREIIHGYPTSTLKELIVLIRELEETQKKMKSFERRAHKFGVSIDHPAAYRDFDDVHLLEEVLNNRLSRGRR